MRENKNITPSEFYRIRRPENFSDSKEIHEVELTKEHFSFELEKITTNQKQDEFESLCRKLVEKLITPNLIPMTGPTGGGDGKTDSETYPVSKDISNRWFVPENGWTNNEKWAFAFSAKKDWKAKAKSDIQKIVGTGREFTKAYFVTNQTPSSRQIKDTQDELFRLYQIETIILNGTWIVEKVFDNKLFNIAVDSLNLSGVYKNKQLIVGKNDAERTQELQELEDKIENPNRYSENDFQLVEDALEAAILSRQLEKSRDEVEGRFVRTTRFCEKVNLSRQWVRLHYQKAWTYLYYYDDYEAFIREYRQFKKYISDESPSAEIELYVNLYNSLRGMCAANCNLKDYGLNLEEEGKILYSTLESIASNSNKPSSSLSAQVYLTVQKIMDFTIEGEEPDMLFESLVDSFEKSTGLLDFPFEGFHHMIEEIGSLFPNNSGYDNLINLVASIAESRSSELTSGRIFLKRGIQKSKAKFNQESVVYFGKAIYKLAKDESEYDLYFALKGLGHSFKSIGLLWASNNCFVCANSIALKKWHQKGILDKKVYDTTKQIALNELLLGRIPEFLSWHELLSVIDGQIGEEESDEEPPTLLFFDALLSVRILNTHENEANLSVLPDILDSAGLWQSESAALYKLGHIDPLFEIFKEININSEAEISTYFNKVAGQPFRNQIKIETQFLSEDYVILKSKILGCTFTFAFEKDAELLLAAETFAAYFENFLSTSFKEIFPTKETIEIHLLRKHDEPLFRFTEREDGAQYDVEINKFSFKKNELDELSSQMLNFISHVLARNFHINDMEKHLEKLFGDEEVNQRLTFVFGHRDFTTNILGDKPKLFYSDWSVNKNQYENKRTEPLKFSFPEIEPESPKNLEEIFENSRHDENKVISIIDEQLWNQASWKGFGRIHLPSNKIGVFLAFENEDAGKLIFSNWRKRFGREDREGIIKLTIIKGVNQKHPHWYKVHVSANIDAEIYKKEGQILSVLARFHKMTPSNSENLKIIEQKIKEQPYVPLFPALIKGEEQEIVPHFDSGIIIKNLVIKNAWEVGIHDLEQVVFLEDDDPIIPPDMVDVPIIEVLKRRK